MRICQRSLNDPLGASLEVFTAVVLNILGPSAWLMYLLDFGIIPAYQVRMVYVWKWIIVLHAALGIAFGELAWLCAYATIGPMRACIDTGLYADISVGGDR